MPTPNYWDLSEVADLQHIAFNQTANQTIIAATAGKRVVVFALHLVMVAAGTFKFVNGAAATQISPVWAGDIVLGYNRASWLTTLLGEGMKATLTGTWDMSILYGEVTG